MSAVKDLAEAPEEHQFNTEFCHYKNSKTKNTLASPTTTTKVNEYFELKN
jgi:hypothetical protein